MTTGQLSPDVVIGGVIHPDLRSFYTSDINGFMTGHSTTVSRTVFYAQWALAESGAYTGPVDGIVGSTNAIYNAFVALYDANYSGPNYARPSGGTVSFKYYAAVIFDNSAVDNAIYKVVA